jgi:hypothetical protein
MGREFGERRFSIGLFATWERSFHGTVNSHPGMQRQQRRMKAVLKTPTEGAEFSETVCKKKSVLGIRKDSRENRSLVLKNGA